MEKNVTQSGRIVQRSGADCRVAVHRRVPASAAWTPPGRGSHHGAARRVGFGTPETSGSRPDAPRSPVRSSLGLEMYGTGQDHFLVWAEAAR